MVPAKPEYDPDNPNSPAREAVETVQQLLWQVGTVDYETRSNLRDMAASIFMRRNAALLACHLRLLTMTTRCQLQINNSDVVDLLCWRQCHARPIKTCAVNVIGGGDGAL